MSSRVFIHEQIEIIGDKRARYLDYMCEFAPTARTERGMRLFGIWGALGSTTRWPAAVNLWETSGWDAMAQNFAHETGHSALHDPSLRAWIGEAQDYRSGGFDRLLVAADFMPLLEDLIASPDILAAKVFHHETYSLPLGQADAFLDLVQRQLLPMMTGHGALLAGAFRTAMRGGAEVILIWAIPEWAQWNAIQQTLEGANPWAATSRALITAYEAHALLSGPRSPLRTGAIL